MVVNSEILDRKNKKKLDGVEMFVIPREVVSRMLSGRKGIDCKGNHIPARYIDPYPARKVDENNFVTGFSRPVSSFEPQVATVDGVQRPMSSAMCSWLMERLVLCRPSWVPVPASGDRGQCSDARALLKFDRLYTESVIRLHCGSLVTIQFLHGVLTTSSLTNDDISGCPAGAIRFCPAYRLPELVPGITIVVYDTHSDVTVACAVEGRVLSRTAAAFKLTEEDIPIIVSKLSLLADKVLKLTRVGFRCTSVSLDLNTVLYLHYPQSGSRKKPLGEAPRIVALGRRAVVSDPRSARLRAAKMLMSTQSMM